MKKLLTNRKFAILVMIILIVIGIAINYIGQFFTLGQTSTLNNSADTYIQDNANVLASSTVRDITQKNNLLEQKSGAQIVVVTVATTGRQAINEYAYDYFNERGIGSAQKNNGFLLLLAIDDDDYYALQGDGLRQLISNDYLADIMSRYMEADFAAGNYDTAVRNTFNKVYQELDRYYEQQSKETTTSALADLIILIFIIVLIVGIINRLRHRRNQKRPNEPPPSGGGQNRPNQPPPGGQQNGGAPPFHDRSSRQRPFNDFSGNYDRYHPYGQPDGRSQQNKGHKGQWVWPLLLLLQSIIHHRPSHHRGPFDNFPPGGSNPWNGNPPPGGKSTWGDGAGRGGTGKASWGGGAGRSGGGAASRGGGVGRSGGGASRGGGAGRR